MAAKAKIYVLKRSFEGAVKEEDFEIITEELPPIKDGEFLAEAIYISVDPYMRAYKLPPGIPMIGGQIAKVIDSKNEQFPIGCHIYGNYGWRTLTIGPLPENGIQHQQYVLPDFKGHPKSLGLGALGMPGNTAYFGFLEVCKPQEGEVIAISGAAGAVGSLVGQIAKIKNCTVIGVAGSDKKGKWLINELGFDYFVNYKDPNWPEKLKEFTPNGIDCYFDNVGGEISSEIMKNLNQYGRVAICGNISAYNESHKKLPKATMIQPSVVLKQLKLEGFVFMRWNDVWMDGIKQMLQWIEEDKIKYKETVWEGFENMVKAFADLLQGGNTGKAVVRVSPDSSTFSAIQSRL